MNFEVLNKKVKQLAIKMAISHPEH